MMMTFTKARADLFVLFAICLFAFILSPIGYAQSAHPTGISCGAPVQKNKISKIFGEDLQLLLNNNRVEIKDKKQTAAKGLGFGYKIANKRLLGRMLLTGGPRLKEICDKAEKIQLIDGTELIGWICGLSKNELVIQTEKGVFSVTNRFVKSVDSKRCWDFSIPLGNFHSADLVKNQLQIKIGGRAGSKVSVWNEPRNNNWFEPLVDAIAPLAGAEKSALLLCMPTADFDGEELAVCVVNRLEEENSEKHKKAKQFRDPKEWIKKPPKPIGPDVSSNSWWIAQSIIPQGFSLLVDSSKFIPIPFDLWSFQIQQRIPGLRLVPRGANAVPVQAARPGAAWTYEQITQATAPNYTQFLHNNFSKLDADGNGFIDKHEAAIAVTNADWKKEEGIYVATLYRTIELLEEYSNDEKFDEDDGVTDNDITAYGNAKGRNEVTKILSNVRVAFNAANTRDVFVPSGPSATGVSQGFLNDCYFQAVVAGVASMSPQLIQSMVQELGNYPVGERKFVVTMPGTGPITVSEPTDAELSMWGRGTDNGIWMAIIEKAYANWAAPNGTDICPQDALQGGSSDGGGFRTVLGGGFTSVDPLNDDGNPNTGAVHTALVNAFQTQQPVMFGISTGEVHGISGHHLYAVTAYNPETQVVTLYNSLNEEPMSTLPNVDHGSSPNDGIFSLPLQDALGIFTHVQVSEVSIPEASTVVQNMKATTVVAEAPSGHQPPPGFFVCYGKPVESSPEPETGHNPPPGTFVCYGRAPEPPESEPKDPLPTGGHNPPEGFFVCYGQGSAPEDKTPPAGGGHNPPPGFFVCYGTVPEQTVEDPAPPEEGGHNPPPGFFVCYGQVPPTDKVPPKKSSSLPPNFMTPAIYDPVLGWVNIYGVPVTASPPKLAEKSADSQKQNQGQRKSKNNNSPNTPSSEKIGSSEKVATTSDAKFNISSISFATGVLTDSAQTLQQACENGKVKIEKLASQNEDPLNSILYLRNLTPQKVTCSLPAFSFFISADASKFQNMMKGADPLIQLAANEVKAIAIDTFCVSTKSIKPPPANGADYTMGAYPDSQAAAKIRRIVEKAYQLEENNKYADVPVNQAMRARKIAQATIWLYLGSKSANVEDKVTAASLREDLLKSAQIPRDQLNNEQLEKIQNFAQELFDAAKKTLSAAN